MGSEAFDEASVLAWALDAVPMPVVCIGPDYRYLAFNQAHADAYDQLYGRRPTMGQSILDFISVEADRAVVRANLDRALSGEEFATEGWRGEGDDRRHFTIRYAPRYDRGEVVGATVVGMDTTDTESAKELRALSRQAILDASDAPSYALDCDLRYVAFNDAWVEVMEHTYGKTPHVGQSYLESLGSDEDRKQARAYFDRVLKGETLHTQDWRGELGIRRHWTGTRSPVRSGDEIVGLVAVAQDTTEHALRQQEIAEEAQRVAERARMLDEVVGGARDAIIVVDAQGIIREFNQEAERMTGYSAEEAVGTPAAMLASQEDVEKVRAILDTSRDDGVAELPRTKVRREDGRLLDASVRVVRTRDDSGALTGAHVSMRSLELSAYYDDLTGLCSRRGLTEFGRHAIAQAHRTNDRVGLLFADLDTLKLINDEFGHPIGDIALRDVAKLLHGLVRDADIVARVGGDEFVVLAVGGPREGVETLAARFLAECDSFNAASNRPYALSISIGVAVSEPGEKRDLDALIQEADRAMYAEKQRRRSERERTDARAGGRARSAS